MEKIISFKKNIPFKTNIYEITSVSLEHTLSLKEENLIIGNFIISGTYKITSSSLNLDEFNFEVPLEINIDKKYETKDITIDINDFYYELINNKELLVNIEVIIENLEEKEETFIDEEKTEKIEPQEAVTSIFESLDDNENYVTYKVHIVTENDTIESITQKYGININKLELYNDLTGLKLGDKIIIPTDD
ncbi:MAG: LysM peptidoglycan-binding domain-containing protein [Bacilli bacterium]|nr:LysM peptidoglycan-binding domain-containing protein [Bacilli bacterium]